MEPVPLPDYLEEFKAHVNDDKRQLVRQTKHYAAFFNGQHNDGYPPIEKCTASQRGRQENPALKGKKSTALATLDNEDGAKRPLATDDTAARARKRQRAPKDAKGKGKAIACLTDDETDKFDDDKM
ncbi:uncharacterized protein J7T54_001933 [Emericellopsis cladophorae]|uniref:Uncharacterized protein n=1 Tax=Emericellopsis cladophorae TaxID=2686198 RepID=A0A9Q0BBJ5_9HYPO|nr:uncharacterized protein J7T54_001933 [Emericellopsis cladophorae]KAI6778129.1 hypothetical protein J7T54_001933 [Emericellopsis cladophorae]